MAKVDNDATKHKAQPFVIMAQKRSGGTYLAHCLSSHLDIFCDRGESLHHMGIWRRRMSLSKIVYALTHQEGYLASGFKAICAQGLDSRTWPHIAAIKPRIIHLTRRNKLRQGASIALNRAIRRGKATFYPVHTFKTVSQRPLPKYSIAPDAILRECRSVAKQDAGVPKRIGGHGITVMHIQYHELTGGEGTTRASIAKPAATKLCKFLGVPLAPLRCRLKRVHSHPLRAMFANWPEIEGAVKGTEFAKFLAEEERWIQKGGKWTVIDG